MKLAAGACAVLASVALAAGQSQRPSPTPTKAAQKQQDQSAPEQAKPAADKRPAANAVPALVQTSTVVTGGNQGKQGTPREGEAPPERWPKVNAILISVFTGVLTGLAFFQWRTMRRQAKLMDDQLVEMTAQRALAREQFDEATKQIASGASDTATMIDTAVRQADAITQMIQTGAQQVAAMKTLADASAKSAESTASLARSAEESVRGTREFSRLDHRASLIVQRSTKAQLRPVPLTDRQPIFSATHIDLIIVNAGRTPAKNVRICSLIQYSDYGFWEGKEPRPYVFSETRDFDEDCLHMVIALTDQDEKAARRDLERGEGFLPFERQDVAIIYPGEPFPLTVCWFGGYSGVVMKPPWFRPQWELPNSLDAEKGGGFLFVVARLTYEDIFGLRRNTIYCGRWRPPSDRVLTLGYGNYSD